MCDKIKNGNINTKINIILLIKKFIYCIIQQIYTTKNHPNGWFFEYILRRINHLESQATLDN